MTLINLTDIIPGDRTKKKFNQFTIINVYKFQSGGSGESSTTPIRLSSTPDGVSIESDSSIPSINSESTRIETSIVLPLPSTITSTFSNDWSSTEIGFSENIVSGLSDSLQFDDFSRIGSDLKDSSLNALIGAISSTFARKASRNKVNLAHNPHKEIFYNSPQFRDFKWEWGFSPSSEEESDKLHNFIYNITKYSHPEYQGGNQAAYKYPETFTVEFHGIKNIPKMASLALTSVDVDYSSSGTGPRFFVDGSPAFIKLSLSFMELIPLTKREIDFIFDK